MKVVRIGALVLLLVVIALGTTFVTLATAGDGDSPDDPIYVRPGDENRTYRWFGFSNSNPEAQIVYDVFHIIEGVRQLLLDDEPHVAEMHPHELNVVVQGNPGELNIFRVIGTDLVSGMADSCAKYLVRQEHHANGCECPLR